MAPFQPGAEKSPEPKAPAGLAGKVGHTARQRPPDPKGKGIALALIAGIAVVAAIYQIATGSGAGKTVRDIRAREAHDADTKERSPIAPRAPREEPLATPPPNPRPVEIEVEGLEGGDDLPPMPGADIPMPEAIGERTAGRLRLSLNALTSGGLVAESGIRELPLILADAAEDEREAVRGIVVDTLASLVGSRRLGGPAFDAAIRLAADDVPGLGPITLAALGRGLKEDRGAPAALVYLGELPAQDREASAAAVAALVKDRGRPLHLRVLAARALVGWDLVDEALAALAADPRTPAVLRKALAP